MPTNLYGSYVAVPEMVSELVTTYRTVTDTFDLVKSIFGDNLACMDKQDCVSKLVDGQDKPTLRFARDILFSISRRRRNAKVCSLVEHRSGDDTWNKMVNDMYELIQFGEGYRENLSKGLQAAGECGKVNTSSQHSNSENFEHTVENFIKEKVYNDLKDETEKNPRKLKEFIIEDMKPVIKSEIEGKLITDVNHTVSDVTQ